MILAAGSYFSDMANPKPVLQIGSAGDSGSVELSDFVVATRGATEGAILIEYNMVSSAGSPSGMWDVHTRIGGFAGSQLQVAQCAKNPSSTTINPNCIAAFMSMHITPGSTGLYLENNWVGRAKTNRWTAD